MKQRVIKYQSDLFKQEITLTVDENLNKLKGKVLAPKKLEAANKALRKQKELYPNRTALFFKNTRSRLFWAAFDLGYISP